METFILFKVMLKRQWLEFIRYLFNMLLSLLIIFIAFMLLFMGIQEFVSRVSGYGETLDSLVVGFIVWLFATLSYTGIATFITRESQLGTIEQLAMSPLGMGKVVLFRLFSDMILNYAIIVFMLLLVMSITGRWLAFDMASASILSILTIVSAQGIGLFVGGLALVFKQVQAEVQFVQLAFVVLIAMPLETFSFLKLCPLIWGNNLIGEVMVRGISITEIPLEDVLSLLGISSAYFALGLAAFKLLEYWAREKGVMGHY